MKTNYLKNIFLLGSGIAIATSTAIFASAPQGVSIQANLVNLVQYLGELHITSDGTPNGDSILSVDGNGEFSQNRGTSQLINTESLNGSYPFVGATNNSGGHTILAGVLGNAVATLANQDATGSGMSSYFMAQSDRAMLGFNADLTNQTDRVTELQVLDYGIVFRFPQGEYTFPLTAGTSGQVLTTDGSNELSWADPATAPSDTKTTTVYLSSSDILSLDTTPIVLIPAPTANQINVITELIMIYRFGTTPYYIGDNMMDMRYLRISYGIAPDFAYNELGFNSVINAPADAIRISNGSTVYTSGLGQNLQMSISGNGAENGDGTLEVRITYKTIDM